MENTAFASSAEEDAAIPEQMRHGVGDGSLMVLRVDTMVMPDTWGMENNVELIKITQVIPADVNLDGYSDLVLRVAWHRKMMIILRASGFWF